MFDRYSVIDMFGPIYGENWHNPELHDGLTYRWSHPNPDAMLVVPTLNASQIRLRIILAHPPQARQLDELGLTVDGRPAALRWSMRGPFVNLWTDLAFEHAIRSVKIRITSPACATSPSSVDTRLLGLAVNRVEVFALEEEALGVQNQDLQDQLRQVREQLELTREQLKQAQLDLTAASQPAPATVKRGLSSVGLPKALGRFRSPGSPGV